jgi:hypothetical protein
MSAILQGADMISIPPSESARIVHFKTTRPTFHPTFQNPHASFSQNAEMKPRPLPRLTLVCQRYPQMKRAVVDAQDVYVLHFGYLSFL